MLPVLVLLVIALAIFEPTLLSTGNLLNVLSQSAVVGIAAIGATFVILTGGIDLSVGSTIGASGVAAAAVMHATGNILLGIVAGLLVGSGVGLLMGVLINRLNLVPFVVTLAGLFIVAGATTLLSNGATISRLPAAFTGISVQTFVGLPIPVFIAVILYIAAQLVLSTTVWGRRLVLLGASRKTSVISGSSVARVEISVYLVAGLFASIAGIVLTANLFAANASMGTNMLLNIIGAVVIGGTSLFGGRGSVARTAIGVLLLGFLANGMNLIGLASYDQVAITGAVILAAASLDALLHRTRR
jgi:ribose transport system permease protein